MAGKLDVQGMGAYHDAQARKAAAQAERERQLRAQEIEEQCCECGVHGGHSDGQFWYCSEHLPDDYYKSAVEAEAFTRAMRAAGHEWPPRTNFYRPPSKD